MSRIRTGACREDRDAIRRHWPFAEPTRSGEPPVTLVCASCAIGDCPASNACIDARRCLARRVDA